MDRIAETHDLIPFHGAQLPARKTGEDIYVAIKPICDHLGIAYQPQHRKLVEDGKFNSHLMVMVAEDGRQREMLAIERRDLAGWLYGINVSRIGQGLPAERRAQVQALLTAYQRESTDVLHDHWTRRAAAPVAPQGFVLPTTFSEALRALADAEDARVALATENARMLPKAEAFDHLISADGTYSVAEAAKIINRPDLGPLKLYELLRQRNILMTGGDKHNVPFQQFIDRGYFKVRAGSRPSTSQGTVSTSTTRVTPKGLAWICKNVLSLPLPLSVPA